MDVGVGVSDAIQRFVETECPQNGDVGAESDTGLAELERVEGVSIDASFGGYFGDRHAAAGPSETDAVPEIFDAFRGLNRDGLLDDHYFRR
jgi:hypothetical protein